MTITAHTPRPTADRPRTPSTAQLVRLVAEREIGSRLRSKAFVISSLILFIAAAASVVWGGFAASNASSTPVAATSATVSQLQGLPGLDVQTATSPDDAVALVEAGTVDAAVVPAGSVAGADVPGGSSFDYVVIAKESAPAGLVQALSATPPVHLLEPPTTDDLLRYFLAIGFGIVFLMAASTFGSTISSSVVEEKQTRVVEILLSAIPVRALLAGKVIGNTIMAMAQIIILAGIAIAGLAITGQDAVLAGLGAPILWFAVFFFFGFVLLASLFAAAGAMVSRMEDLGSTTFPITMLVMAPYFLVIFFNDNPVVLTVMSYVPFSAPVAMPLRMYLGSATWWEPVISLVILVLSAIGAILIGAKIYQNSLLRMGGRVKLREALAG